MQKFIHNYTINLATKEEKYYYFSSSFDFLKKLTASGSETQFALSRVPTDIIKLHNFLGGDVQLDDILVDTYDFQSDTYWIMTEISSVPNLVKLYRRLLINYKVTEKDFLHWAGYLNSLKINSLEECAEKKCLACIRIPLKNNRLKIYARPFRYHQFPLDEDISERIKKVLCCDEESFTKQMDAGGISYDFSDGRIVLFTQNDELKKLR